MNPALVVVAWLAGLGTQGIGALAFFFIALVGTLYYRGTSSPLEEAHTFETLPILGVDGINFDLENGDGLDLDDEEPFVIVERPQPPPVFQLSTDNAKMLGASFCRSGMYTWRDEDISKIGWRKNVHRFRVDINVSLPTKSLESGEHARTGRPAARPFF